VSTPSAQMHVLKDSDGPHTAYVLRPTSYFQHLLKDVISPAHSPCRAGAALRFISRGSSGCLGDISLVWELRARVLSYSDRPSSALLHSWLPRFL